MQWWQDTLARIGIHTPFGRDAAGAAVIILIDVGLSVIAFTVADAELQQPITAFSIQLGVVAAAGAALSWRRSAPRAVLAAIVVAQLVINWIYAEQSALFGFGPLVATYSVGAHCPRRRATAALGAAAGVTVVFSLGLLVAPTLPFGAEPNTARQVFGALMGSVFGLALPGVIGGYIRARRLDAARLQERTQELAREGEERARQAALEERGRIARELHDVASHHLSGMVLQAGAAERQVGQDPQEACRVLGELREQGSATLAQMRHIIGVLREDDDGASAPSLRYAEGLVEEARRTGCAATLSVEGESDSALAPTVDSTGYRVLQEALSNARRHAPQASVAARVVYGSEALEVEVTNGPPPEGAVPNEEGGGHGLAGMRERVALAGGELAAGATSAGGWRVHARLPMTARQVPTQADGHGHAGTRAEAAGHGEGVAG
jgi:signal transduction histidine kinase